MARVQYRDIKIGRERLEIIDTANAIASAYERQGLSLTLRQLYYRFVSTVPGFPNTQQSYKRLGAIIGDARYAGLFDWELITDRTRNATGGDHGSTPGHPEETINPYYYSVTQWEGQPERVEVWVEKDALIDVIQKGAGGLRATTFSCRGYTSSSEIWAAAQRIEGYLDEESVENVTILHLGDHDPSGIDMSRDIDDRLLEFIEGDGYFSGDVTIKRIALNWDQIQQYQPPPNPAKETDSRFEGYRVKFGNESWELDALEPRLLIDLIQGEIRPLIDDELWNKRLEITAKGRATLKGIRDNYPAVVEFLQGKNLLPEAEIEDEENDEG